MSGLPTARKLDPRQSAFGTATERSRRWRAAAAANAVAAQLCRRLIRACGNPPGVGTTDTPAASNAVFFAA